MSDKHGIGSKQIHSYTVEYEQYESITYPILVCNIDISLDIIIKDAPRLGPSSDPESFTEYQLCGEFSRVFEDRYQRVKTLKAKAYRPCGIMFVKLVFGKMSRKDGGVIWKTRHVRVWDALLWMEAFFRVPMDEEYAQIIDSVLLQYHSSDDDDRRSIQRSFMSKIGSTKITAPSPFHLKYLARIAGPYPETSTDIVGSRGQFLYSYVLENIHDIDDDGNYETCEGCNFKYRQ